MYRRTYSLVLLLELAVAFVGVNTAQTPALRPVTPQDFDRLEHLRTPKLSPDGELLAYIFTRSLASGVSGEHDALHTEQLSEVWVAPVASGTPKRIAGGGSDGVGFWSIEWSPDGQRLALKSALPSGRVGLWVWNRNDGSLRKLVEAGLSYGADPQWMTNEQLLYSLAAEGGPPPLIWPKVAIDEANAAWAKALRGQSSVSVLESGVVEKQPQESWATANVQTMERKTIYTGNSSAALISPGGRYIAWTSRLDTTKAATGRAYEQGPQGLLGLDVATVDGKVLSGTDRAQDVLPYSLRWSLDGSQIALIAHSRLAADAPLQVFVYRVDSQALVPMNTRGIIPVADYYRNLAKMFWTANNELLVYSRPDSVGAVRNDWWVVSEKEEPHNLTQGMKAAPTRLLPERANQSFLGIAQGQLWRLPVDGVPQQLSLSMGGPLTAIFWPSGTLVQQVKASANDLNAILVSSLRTASAVLAGQEPSGIPGLAGLQVDLFAFDLTTGKSARLDPPVEGATFHDFARKGGAAVYSVEDHTGTYLWLAGTSVKAHRVLETNSFLREIAQPVWKKIQYRGLDGNDLTGWVLLPIGYQEGKRYPLITCPYLGLEQGSAPPAFETVNDTIGYHNGPLLSAHGYAVLYPSMPRKIFGTTADNYMELTKGVLPAVDRVIEMGIADSKRLGLLGNSYGGFSVYGLITQTKRFQAAVAQAGPADFISNYGQFDGRERYGSFPQAQAVSIQAMSETGPLSLGVPPWKDAERYIRNSPIFYVDRVETPVLIIQGDMDYVPIQQGEEFFMAMYRQGKRARFLRYWTSGHAIGGANMEDMWKQIYAWLDEFLKPREDSKESLSGTTKER